MDLDGDKMAISDICLNNIGGFSYKKWWNYDWCLSMGEETAQNPTNPTFD